MVVPSVCIAFLRGLYAARGRRVLGAALILGLFGCPAEQPPECVAVDLTCAPGYVPTFTNVYRNTLSASCGGAKSSCHSSAGSMGGLAMPDAQTTYANLLAPSRRDPSRLRVVAGDPACSPLIVRTNSPGSDYQMPPGDALSPEERCALVHWVADGAQP